MIKRNILDCMTLVGGTPSHFEGEKTYVSTGAVDCDHVDYAQTERVTYDNRPSRANLSVAEGDILFAKMCGTKKTLRIDRQLSEHLYSTGFCAVRANESLMDAALLYHLLASDQFLTQKDQNSSGATQKAITNAGLRKIVIRVPDLSEQRKLAANLDCIKQMMAKRREQLVSFDQLVKSRFIELFGDPIDNTMCLKTMPLGEACFLKAGITTAADAIHEQSAVYPVPCYGGNGIRGYVKEATQHGCYPIIGRQGALCGNVQMATGEFHATEHAVLVTPLIETNVVWLFHLLRMMDLYRFHTGAAQPGLAVKTLNTVDIPIAEIAVQNNFASFVEQTDKSKLCGKMEVAA